MFYSHQLLARKAPLGQIWMAATMHAKINRRKLDKLDIIQICEEILNPSIPMALRLSGILMGGVVIVYERKVKLLYDDVTRFLVEINEAWKIKAIADPTVLPKGKTQAKYEAVTLPDAVDMDVEQPMHFSDATVTTARFQRMRLDYLDEHYINIAPNDDVSQDYRHHQADAANITLFDDFGSCIAETDLYNRFERFDMEGDEETQINFTPQEPPEVPATLVPSPSAQDAQPQVPDTFVPSPPMHEPPQDGTTRDHMVEEQAQEEEQATEVQRRQQPPKRKARWNHFRLAMDNEQLMIPGNIYQSWLQDPSDIVSRRGRRVQSLSPIRSTKVGTLVDLPPVVLNSGLETFPTAVHYPAFLMELMRKSTQVKPATAPNSDGTPPREQQQQQQQPQPIFSPPEHLHHHDLPEFSAGEIQNEMGSHPLDVSIEKLRANLENMDFQAAGDGLSSDHFASPGSPARHSANSFSSSGSGHNLMPVEPEIQLPSGRLKRRQQSSSRTSLGNLDPVEEELPLHQDVRGFKIRRLSEDGPTPDLELLEETGPTQTLGPVPSDPSINKITQSIRTHLKLHFDTPGAPQSESLNQLAFGMNRKKAAQLFYQTCVLVTCDFIKVEQAAAYTDIIITRGPKM